jgi:predicted methyltransferase
MTQLADDLVDSSRLLESPRQGRYPRDFRILFRLKNIRAANMDAASLARLSCHDANNFTIQHSQTLHRLELLRRFKIADASHVLELGCGQGDCTVVLAEAVGEEGSVVGVDPANVDYGKVSLVGLVSTVEL